MDSCSKCKEKDNMIKSMAEEIENLTEQCSQTIKCSIEDNASIVILNKMIKQAEIKKDLEISFLQTKVTLLEETLRTKNTDLETLDAFKENNTHLLALLDKYDRKMVEMQNDIDIRDLRIDHLVRRYEEGSKKLDLNMLESKIRFLLELLSNCK